MTEEAKKETPKKVAILGFAPTYEDAPFDDESFEIWTCNSLFRRVPRVDRQFDFHPFDTFDDERRKGTKKYVEEMAELDCPVYLQKQHPQVPNSVAYPLQEVVKEVTVGCLNKPYFTNSISMMIALAIVEGYDAIHVYGVDMAQDTEYADQRPSCEYFLGMAAGRGIDIHVPKSSNLLKTKYVYGYEDKMWDAFTEKEKERIEFLKKQKREMEQKRKQAEKAVAQYEGAINSASHVVKQWGRLNYRDKSKL